MASGDGSNLPLPYSMGRGKGRGRSTNEYKQKPSPASSEPLPPGRPRAIIGATHKPSTMEDFITPGYPSVETKSHKSAGRGFLKIPVQMRPMKKETEHMVLLAALTRSEEHTSNPIRDETAYISQYSSEESYGYPVMDQPVYTVDQPVQLVENARQIHIPLIQDQPTIGIPNYEGLHGVTADWSHGGYGTHNLNMFENYQTDASTYHPHVQNTNLQIYVHNVGENCRREVLAVPPSTNNVHTEECTKTTKEQAWNLNADVFVPSFITGTTQDDPRPTDHQQEYTNSYYPSHIPQQNVSHDVHFSDTPISTQGNNEQRKNVPAFLHNIPPSLTELSNDDAINILRATLARLIQIPGNMEDVTWDLNETLNSSITKKDTLKEMVNIIFHLVVLQKPFAYTAARLCKQLCGLYILRDTDGTWDFRSELLRRCQQLFKERTAMDINQLCGFALFIAELYNVCTWETDDKIDILAIPVIHLLKDMINSDHPDLLKTAIKVLKCNGIALEDRDKKLPDDKKCMGEIYAMITHVAEERGDETIRLMVKKLNENRDLDWGREQSDPVDIPALAEGEIFVSEPVFYDHTGQCISRNEAGYHDEVKLDNPNDYSISQSDKPQNLSEDESYDDDYDNAYEEFLRSTGQS